MIPKGADVMCGVTSVLANISVPFPRERKRGGIVVTDNDLLTNNVNGAQTDSVSASLFLDEGIPLPNTIGVGCRI